MLRDHPEPESTDQLPGGGHYVDRPAAFRRVRKRRLARIRTVALPPAALDGGEAHGLDHSPPVPPHVAHPLAQTGGRVDGSVRHQSSLSHLRGADDGWQRPYWG